MQFKRRKSQSPPATSGSSGGSASGAPRRTTVSSRREIKVEPGQTLVVTPKISGGYRTMIIFSFILNLILTLVLLVVAFVGWRAWREYQGIAAQLGGQFNPNGAIGETVRPLVAEVQNGPAGRQQVAAAAVGLTQQKLGDVMGAVEGLQNATIRATIPIDKQLPIQLQVPVDQDTVVVVTQSIPLVVPASIVFPGGGGNLNATVALNLPPGLELPVHLAMTIPLTSSVPVKFDVPVTIPLRDTELAGPFARLHTLLQPLADLFKPAPTEK